MSDTEKIAEALATAMADSWMGDEVDCADVGSILVPAVTKLIKAARAEIYGEMSVVPELILEDPRVRWAEVQLDKDLYRELRSAFEEIRDGEEPDET